MDASRQKGSAETSSPKPDVIQTITGSFGRYQFMLCGLIFLTKFPIAFHQMAIIFLAPKTAHTCEENSEKNCPCKTPVYDTSIFTNTIIMEWDLICEKKWLANFNQTIFQLGTLIGSIIFGMASDKFGRKRLLLIAVVMQLMAGVLAAYAPDFWSFSFARFIIGVSVGGTMVTGFVIIIEFVGAQYREVISALYQVPYNLGHMCTAAFGFFLRDYVTYQLAISMTAVVMLSYFCLVPETPRWLIAMNKTDKAVKILEKVARTNKLPTESIKKNIEDYQQSLQSNIKNGSIIDLFRTPNLRKNTLSMAFNWLTCSYCFFGISQYVGQLSGNVFINVASSATFALMGTLLSIPLMKVVGRRTMLIIFNIICAFCLIILSVLPEGLASVVCASMGVAASFVLFVVVYLYCSELFPTVVRNAALGFSSMSARIGSMMAPFVVGMRDKAIWIPPLLFAILPVIAGFICLFLPETKGHPLTTTIEEGERFGQKKGVVINT